MSAQASRRSPVFPDPLIRDVAKKRLGGRSLATFVLEQAWTEGRLRILRQVNFRRRDNREATRAYQTLSVREFEGINARQRWANWRTVPRNLSGHLPSRPLRALDLCCGVGHSTEVLAAYLPRGSKILGLEFNPEFVRTASRRRYPGADGRPVDVKFRAQSVLETFRDASDRRIPDGSIDLVNSCGAVGSHFDSDATRRLVAEISRVLRPGGLATIDSGLPGTSPWALTAIFRDRGFEVVSRARSCFVDPCVQVCFRKKARAGQRYQVSGFKGR